MKLNWLKQVMPRGLYGRAALILIVPVITIQLVVSVVFIQRHFDRVTRQMTDTMLREIVLLTTRIETAPTLGAARTVIPDLAEPLDLDVTLPDNTDRPKALAVRRQTDLTGIVVVDAFHTALPNMKSIDLSNGSRVSIYLESRWGPMRIDFDRDRVSASNPHQLLVLMVFVSILMTVIAFIFLRNQLRPIHRLARAAEAFGKGHSITYHPSGATEVRTAGRAFNDMRARIERQIEQRTLMLSGISHDLRTPLTRMRLGLSMLPDDADTRDEISAMERDVDEMAEMINAFLEFSREGSLQTDPELIDIGDMVARVVADARRGERNVSLGPCPAPGTLFLMARPNAIRRAVDNLIGNAVRYGTQALVSVVTTPKTVRILVEDDGPGIPAPLREEALRPFTRLDPSRNQDRGQGVGLGLAIATDILRRHGGTLALGDSKALGGLQAELILPR